MQKFPCRSVWVFWYEKYSDYGIRFGQTHFFILIPFRTLLSLHVLHALFNVENYTLSTKVRIKCTEGLFRASYLRQWYQFNWNVIWCKSLTLFHSERLKLYIFVVLGATGLKVNGYAFREAKLPISLLPRSNKGSILKRKNSKRQTWYLWSRTDLIPAIIKSKQSFLNGNSFHTG